MTSHKELARQANYRQYQLDNARANLQLTKYATDPAVYSFRDEIALTRMLIESAIKSIDFNGEGPEAEMSRTVGASTLNGLFHTLHNMAKTSAKLEMQCGQMMSKELVVAAAQQMVDIVADELNDIADGKERVERITNRLAEALQNKKED